MSKLTIPEVQDLTPFEEDEPALAKWLEVGVLTIDNYQFACRDLSKLVDKIAKVEDERKSLTKPLNDTKRKIDSYFKKPYVHPAEAVEKHLRKLIAQLRRSELNTKALEAAKNIDQSLPLEVQQDMMAQVYREDVLEPTERISTRSKWKAAVVDPDAVPREYLVPDMAKLDALAKEAQGPSTIPGIIFEDVGEVVVKRRK